MNNVLLPAPFGPINEHIVELMTSKEESSTAMMPPKRFVTFFIDIIYLP